MMHEEKCVCSIRWLFNTLFLFMCSLRRRYFFICVLVIVFSGWLFANMFYWFASLVFGITSPEGDWMPSLFLGGLRHPPHASPDLHVGGSRPPRTAPFCLKLASWKCWRTHPTPPQMQPNAIRILHTTGWYSKIKGHQTASESFKCHLMVFES